MELLSSFPRFLKRVSTSRGHPDDLLTSTTGMLCFALANRE